MVEDDLAPSDVQLIRIVVNGSDVYLFGSLEKSKKYFVREWKQQIDYVVKQALFEND